MVGLLLPGASRSLVAALLVVVVVRPSWGAGAVATTRRAAVVGGAAVLSGPTLGGLRAPPPAVASAEVPRAWEVAPGVQMPTLALNTVGLTAEATTRALGLAVECGIGHVDFHPGVERDGVAAYLQKNDRTKVFLTTKVRAVRDANVVTPSEARRRCEVQIAEDRAALGVDAVDMWMLRDAADCEVMRAQWAVLEDAFDKGAVRSLGVVNFCEAQLACLLKTARVKPAVNYYMLHPGMGPDAGGASSWRMMILPDGLRSYCGARGIRTFAYGVLGEPGPDATLLGGGGEGGALLRTLGAKYGKAPEAIALRWALQSGVAVSTRPTADFALGVSQCRGDGSCRSSLDARADAQRFNLDKRDMASLDALRAPNGIPALFSPTCNPNLGTGNPEDPLRPSSQE